VEFFSTKVDTSEHLFEIGESVILVPDIVQNDFDPFCNRVAKGVVVGTEPTLVVHFDSLPSNLPAESWCLVKMAEKLSYYKRVRALVVKFKTTPLFKLISNSFDNSKKMAEKFHQRKILGLNTIDPMGLYPSEKRAVSKAVSSSLSLIQAPPGTRKALTAGAIIKVSRKKVHNNR
jgi:hypothetical protein